MNELTKIKDVSSRYGITARTLRYYEDAGLITSTRNEDYAHRLYDETAIMRLKQIIILRKLNISIKNIKQIFDAPGSELVLEILEKKADDIDNEVSLLHELKGIILDFISQIKKVDFHSDSDVKLLYDKANEIEVRLTGSDYNGNPSVINPLPEGNTNKITHVVDLEKMVRIYFDDAPEGGYTGEHSFTEQGELVISSKGFNESDYIGLQSTERFKLPLRIDVVAKSSNEIWLHYNKGGLALNHDTDGSYYLHVNDIFTGQHTSYPKTHLPLDDFTEIWWVLDYSEANVYVNGQHFHTHVWSSSMPYAEKAKIFSPVDVTAGNANTVTVRSIKVTEIQLTMSDMNRLLEVTEKLKENRITSPVAIRAYKLTSQGAMRFIGRKYPGEKEAREEWSQKGLYEILEKQLRGVHKDFYEDGDGPIGLMSMRHGFEYWLGYFTPEGTPVPEDFEYEDFPKRNLGVCWLYGKADEVYMEGIEDIAWKKLEEEGYKYLPNCGDWWIERYSHNRCKPDKMGYAISDICFFVK